MAKKILAIIQARSASKRLPNKILMNISRNITVIENIYNTLSKSKKINQIVVATTKLSSDDHLSAFLKKKNIDFFRGSSNNVYDRFIKTAKKFKANIIVRITADCPLIDYQIVDKVLDNYFNNHVDYSSNITPPTFPDGMDVEVFSFEFLKNQNSNVSNKFDQEHVTTYFRKSNKVSRVNHYSKINQSNFSVTLDDYDDYNKIINIFNYFKNKKLNYKSLIKYLNQNSNKFFILSKEKI